MTQLSESAREKQRAAYLRWREKPGNVERKLASQAARKAKDPQAFAAQKQRQYQNNHAYYRAYQNKYYKDHQEVAEVARKRTRDWNRTLLGIFVKGKRSAKQRGITWSITIEQVAEIREKPCHYCGGALPESGTGIDRKDHLIGYETGNILPCCFDCNRHRGSSWTVDEMLAAVKAVKSVRNGK